jgi:hypothetical protein
LVKKADINKIHRSCVFSCDKITPIRGVIMEDRYAAEEKTVFKYTTVL